MSSPSLSPRIVRGLRIVWTAGFGVLCVLLIVLWVRSYWWMDWLRTNPSTWSVATLDGRLRFRDVYNLNDSRQQQNASVDRQQQTPLVIVRRYHGKNLSLWYVRNGDLVPVGVGKSVPIWPIALAGAALTALPWAPLRFSLRSLLLATALIAATLGLAVWAIR